MKLMAFVSAIITTALISTPAFLGGFVSLGSAAIACGALWMLVLAEVWKRTSLGILLGIQTTIVVANILYGSSIYLAAGGIVFSIISWDLAMSEGDVSSFPSKMIRSFTLRHTVQILLIAALSLGLVLASLQVNMRLGYGTALGLGLGAFLLFAVLLELLSPKSSGSKGRYQRGISEALSTLKRVLNKKDGRSQ